MADTRGISSRSGDGCGFPAGRADASGSLRGDVLSRNLPGTVWCLLCEQCLKFSMGSRVAEVLLWGLSAQEVPDQV